MSGLPVQTLETLRHPPLSLKRKLRTLRLALEALPHLTLSLPQTTRHTASYGSCYTNRERQGPSNVTTRFPSSAVLPLREAHRQECGEAGRDQPRALHCATRASDSAQRGKRGTGLALGLAPIRRAGLATPTKRDWTFNKIPT